MLGKLTFVLVMLALITTPVFAGSGPGPLPEPPGGDGKPPGDEGENIWWPGDPAWLECERAGVDRETYPFAIRIGTGANQDPEFGLTRFVYGNLISVFDVWSHKRTGTVAFDWTAEPDPIAKVIVKSGRASMIYDYQPPVNADKGLTGVGQWDPSHLTFCWGPGGGGNGECYWTEETAWGAGSRYVDQGNWATYTPYQTGVNIIIWAGQNMEAGYLTFSEVVDGMVTVTLTLFDGWRFLDTEENVKIQPYDEIPPAENPSPGSFDIKETATGSPFEIGVPLADYYGIHLEVEWEYCE
jgi:hypothetical protein